jgi:Na+/proline symporter
VVFAALLAAIMSTADAFLNVGTAAIVHDIPAAILGRPLRRELLWARIATAGLAVVAAVVALWSGDLVALLGAFGWGTFAAGLVPVVAIGLNWKRASVPAALIAIGSSLAVNFGFRLGGVRLPYGIDHGAAALVVSLVLFFAVSFVRPAPPLPEDLDAVLEL